MACEGKRASPNRITSVYNWRNFPDPTYWRRWLTLAVVGGAQAMVVLNTTVVNIALP
jgi:hypothetical protein